jgi:ComF family protein
MSRCRRCAAALVTGVSVCGECLIAPPPFASALAAVDYAYPWDRLISDFKFKDALDLADALARLLIGAHAQRLQPAPDLMLAVPLSVGRLRERGYNQSWELARRCAQQLKCQSDDRLLLRIKDTPHQLGLPLEKRATNVHGAFAVEPTRRAELRGRSVTLIDDVMTTQATAGEVTRTLLAAGAASVHLWVVARTPTPGP